MSDDDFEKLATDTQLAKMRQDMLGACDSGSGTEAQKAMLRAEYYEACTLFSILDDRLKNAARIRVHMRTKA